MKSGPIGSSKDGEKAYDNGTECSETSANKIEKPGNRPK